MRFRSVYRANVQVLDTGKGEMGTVINLSESGARLRVGSELPVGTLVRLRIPEFATAATGLVRNCAKRGFGYQIGVEFQGQLYKTSF